MTVIKTPIRGVNVFDVLDAVSQASEISVVDLRGPRRTDDISRPRQVAMALAYEMTLASYPQIGRAMGGRDHTSIVHGYRSAQKRIRSGQVDRDIYEKALEILRRNHAPLMFRSTRGKEAGERRKDQQTRSTPPNGAQGGQAPQQTDTASEGSGQGPTDFTQEDQK